MDHRSTSHAAAGASATIAAGTAAQMSAIAAGTDHAAGAAQVDPELGAAMFAQQP